jgi:hypothetical protein
MTRLAHRWPGFSDARMTALLGDTLVDLRIAAVPGPLEVRLWSATRVASPAFVAQLETAR